MTSLVFKPTEEFTTRESVYKDFKVERDALRDQLSKTIDTISTLNPNFFAAMLQRSTPGAVPAAENSEQGLRTMKVAEPEPKSPEEMQRIAAEYQRKAKIEKKKRYAKTEGKLKEMWRRIAAQCHPDRTKDKKKNELYKHAVEAKDNMDEDALAHLLATLTEGNIDNTRVELLESLIEALGSEIAHLKRSPIFELSLLEKADYSRFKEFVMTRMAV